MLGVPPPSRLVVERATAGRPSNPQSYLEGILFSMPCRACPFHSTRRAGRRGTWLLSTDTRRKLPRRQGPVSPKRTTVSGQKARDHPCLSYTLSRGLSLGSARFPWSELGQ